MKTGNETDKQNMRATESAECPVCGRPVAECDACANGLGEQFALHEMLTGLADELSHTDARARIAQTVAACDAYYPLARSQWESRRSFTLTFIARIAAAVAVLLTLGALFFLAYEKPSTSHDVMFSNATVAEMAAGIEHKFGAKVLISPTANNEAWLQRASISVRNCDANRALHAMALAFDLALEKWDTTFVLRDREIALMEHGKIRHVKMDLSLGHEPDEIARIDTLGNHLLSVDGPKFSAQVAGAVKVPLPYDLSTDVKLMTRKDETYAISRTFPWLVIAPDMKLEFMALTDEDMTRFEAIRAALRGEEFVSPIGSKSLGPLLLAAPALSARTVGEALHELCYALGIDIVIGSGAEVNLPVPPDMASARTVGDALHMLCRSRPFYFTWHEKTRMLIVDERANLQQYLRIMAVNMPQGMDAVSLQLALSTQYPDCFPPASSRTGDSLVQLLDKALLRNHVWPLYLLSKFSMLRD